MPSSKPRIALVAICGEVLDHPITARLKIYRTPQECPYCQQDSDEFYFFDDDGRRQIGKVVLAFGACCTDCGSVEEEMPHAS